tara:strand:+ start:4074 stop:4307 length:234 start_codon:yes stop_codon:yes gene_type:complete
MTNIKLISALHAQATADKEKALMALDLLVNKAVGIGDHTADDVMKDASKALELLCSADDRIATIETYFLEPEDLHEE